MPELVFIGLGLYDEKDITLKGLEEARGCDRVFAEFYTAKLFGTAVEKIEDMLGKKVTVLGREETEKGDFIIDEAKKGRVAFLTAGDTMTATTHIDLRLRAVDEGIKTRVIHGVSIVSAVSGLLGLQQYKFGRTTTLAYPEGDYFPTSPYDMIKENKGIGLHTLVLLDIREDERRYMTANEGLGLLFEMEEKKGEGVFGKDTLICIAARAGSTNPLVRGGRAEQLRHEGFGGPLHTLVIPGKLHFKEEEALVKLAGAPKDMFQE